MKRVASPPRLPARPTLANKVSAGRVLVVGGSANMAGAPALAGLGALRGGAGLVKVAVPQGIQATVAGFRAETTTQGLPQTRAGGLGATALPVLREMGESWDALVVGPGAGRLPSTTRLLRALTLEMNRPLLIDADGLFAWNGALSELRARPAATVLTPHEGEAARLLEITSAEVQSDRRGAALALAKQSGAVVVLKGPGTLVCDGERLYRNKSGGPVLATGGTGDVLAGLIGALLAGAATTGLDPFQAACAGVFAHGHAADVLAEGRDRGLLASELAAGIPQALLSMRRGKKR